MPGWVAIACFFLSGASGLVFEVVWSRELGLVFGSTTLAIATVLSVFMGGLALGSALAGRRADRVRSPLAVYALVEGAVGLYGLAVPLLLRFYPPLAALLYRAVGDHPLPLSLGRFALTAALLLPPTTLMGATLPLLSRFLVARDGDLGGLGVRIGTLYAANTAGAVVGTFLAGFVLLPSIGVRATNGCAAGTNLALGTGVLALLAMARARKRRRAKEELASAEEMGLPLDEVALSLDEMPLPPGEGVLPGPSHQNTGSIRSLARRGAVVTDERRDGQVGQVRDERSLFGAMALGVLPLGEMPLPLDEAELGGPSDKRTDPSPVSEANHPLSRLRERSTRAARRVREGAPGSETSLTRAEDGANELGASNAIVMDEATGPVGEEAGGGHDQGRPLVVGSGFGDGDADGDGDGSKDAGVVSPLQRRVALWAFAVSGAAAMTYQVLWSRALAIVIGSSVYSFTLILLAFLVGLAAGAALWARLSRRSADPVRWLAATHLGVVAMVLLSGFLIDKLPAAFLGLLRGESFTADGILFCQFLLAALAVLPATLFLGGVMPLTVRIYTSGLDRVGRDVGDAYSVNTLGAIVGSFAAGFVVLPGVGLRRGLLGAAAVSAAVGAALCAVSRGSPAKRGAAAAGALAVTAAAMLLLPKWDLGHFQAGLFRVSIAKEIVESGRWAVPELLEYDDGISTTVSVERWGKHLALKNNGKVDASNGDDMPTQIMVGLMPLLFHPGALDRPPRVAVVGYGSGVTVGAVTQFPIAHADVVELEPAIVRASRWFADVNHRPDANPKVRILLDDGRNFLGRSDDTYDVVISEPSNPWITGVSNLFTADYWTMARRRLAEGGVFCQWAQLYELSPTNIKTILRTFASVFPYTYVFSAEDLSSDLILVATNRPLALDRARLARNFANESVRRELLRADVRSADDLLAYLLLTPEEVAAFTAGADVNTDDNAKIEFGAPRDLLDYMRYDPYLARIYGEGWPYGRFEPWLTGLGEGRARAEAEAHIAESLVKHGKRTAAARFLSRARADLPPGEADAVVTRAERLLDLLLVKRTDDPELPLAAEDDPLDAPRLPPGLDERAQEKLALDYAAVEEHVAHRRWAHALQALGRWPEATVDGAGQDLSLLLGFLLYKTEMEDDAVDRLKPLAADAAYVKRRPAVLYYLARSYYGEAFYEAGTREMNRYLDAVGDGGAAGAKGE